jgi:peptidylprolyl isomerase
MATAKKGDNVQVHYTGRLPDGTVFDSSEGRDPLSFEAGGEEVIPGVSAAVVGMQEGEEKTVTLPPEQAYGPHRPELQQKVPREALPEDVKVGDRLQAQAGDQQIPVWVKELGKEHGLVDANHPLAGMTLVFDLKMVGVTPAA